MHDSGTSPMVRSVPWGEPEYEDPVLAARAITALTNLGSDLR
jgi:hypothetical protein